MFTTFSSNLNFIAPRKSRRIVNSIAFNCWLFAIWPNYIGLSWAGECEGCDKFYIWISGCKWSLSEPCWCHYWQWVLATWVMSSYLNTLPTPLAHWSAHPLTVLSLEERDLRREVEIINTWMMILISCNLQTHQYILSAKDVFNFQKKYKENKELFTCQAQRSFETLETLLLGLRTFKNH